MIYIDKLKSVFVITYLVGDKVQLQTQRDNEKDARAYAKALGKKHKVKVNAKAIAKQD
jgi:hypothetical protein